MFLTERQAHERLNSEKNLANRFGKKDDAKLSSQSSDANLSSPEDDKNPDKQVTKQPSISVTEKVISLPGRNRVNLSVEEKTEIAIASRLGESQKTLALVHGITQAEVSCIERGKVKSINEDKVKEALDSVRDKALERLMQSLGLLTEDKLSGCSAKDLSVIASNMGRVVEKINPKTDTPDNINFIIYAPELKQEKSFEVIEI